MLLRFVRECGDGRDTGMRLCPWVGAERRLLYLVPCFLLVSS